MTTCPIYLNECKSLRLNDSIHINELDSVIVDLNDYKQQQDYQIQDIQLKLKQTKNRTKKVGSITFIIGLISGIIIGII